MLRDIVCHNHFVCCRPFLWANITLWLVVKERRGKGVEYLKVLSLTPLAAYTCEFLQYPKLLLLYTLFPQFFHDFAFLIAKILIILVFVFLGSLVGNFLHTPPFPPLIKMAPFDRFLAPLLKKQKKNTEKWKILESAFLLIREVNNQRRDHLHIVLYLIIHIWQQFFMNHVATFITRLILRDQRGSW